MRKSILRRFFRLAPVLIVMLLSVASCSEKNDGKEEISYADKLYVGTMQLVERYRDSISVAVDSAEVNRLFTNFNNANTELVFSFPADTDLHLTERQNDSIITHVLALRALADQRLASMKRTVVYDTVPAQEIFEEY